MSGGGVFDVRQKLKVLRSMIPDCQRYLIPSRIISDLYQVLGDDKRREILEKERSGNRPQAVALLMNAVLAKQEEGLNLFIHALKIQDGKNTWYERFLDPLCGEEGGTIDQNNTQANNYFAFIILCLEGEISREIAAGELHDILRELYSDNIISELDMTDIQEMSLQQGLVELFSVMQVATQQWPLKFFRALERAKPGFTRKIDPCNEPPEMQKAALSDDSASGCLDRDSTTVKKPRTIDYQAEAGPTEEGLSDDLMDVDEDALLESDLESEGGDFSDDDGEKNDKGPEKKARPELSMRKYQFELATPALAGNNVIICAPTGSGKTRVALYIVRQHLEEDESERRKVVFLARSVPLVSQQFKIFDKYLPDCRSRLVTGETGDHDKLHLMLEDYDILVMTPMILHNHLNPDKIPSLSVFSLIIFDECHHTRKGEPYNLVMKKYLDSKKNGERNLPQIVGLTASIGVEKASTVEKAVESIINTMANMDVKKIKKVEENIEELEQTVPRPGEDLGELIPRGGDEISLAIENTMKKIENLMESQFPPPGQDQEIDQVRPLLRKRPADRKIQKYGQWAVKVNRETSKVYIPNLTTQGEREQDFFERRRLFTQNVQLLAETLVVYNDALDVHELMRPIDVLEHLQSKLDPRHPADAPERTTLENDLLNFLQDLQRKLKKTAPTNPNLRKLSDAMREQLRGRWAESRVMVFVRTRATCVALCNWMNSRDVAPELQQLKASPFTGSGAKQESGGMTQAEQEGVVEKFRDGEVKVLVCTSVGQEGMDIPDCNLVIRYNHVGNEVATVQVRGRCRKAGGVSMLIAMPQIFMQERMNNQRVILMNKAIDQVVAMRNTEVSNQVKKAQNKAMDTEKQKKAGQKFKASQKRRGQFSLVCSLCKKVRVAGSQIRVINNSHHVIIGNSLLENGEVSIRCLGKSKRVEDIEFTGEIICNKCPNTKQKLLGTTLKYQEVQYLTLKAVSWIVLDEDNRQVKSGKWQWKDIDMLYDVPELTSRDVDLHLGQTPEDEDDFSLQEEEGQGATGGACR